MDLDEIAKARVALTRDAEAEGKRAGRGLHGGRKKEGRANTQTRPHARHPPPPPPQGNDYGTQYRSGVYYLTDAQRDTAQAFLREEQAAWRDPIVSEVVPAGPWYDAEDYHQRYFEKNPDAGYCRAVVKGKVDKAKAKLPQMLK